MIELFQFLNPIGNLNGFFYLKFLSSTSKDKANKIIQQ